MQETMATGSGALKIVLDCGVDDVYNMSEKVKNTITADII